MSSLLSLSFWFNLNPAPLSSLHAKIILYVFLLCIILAIIFKFVARSKKHSVIVAKTWKKISTLFMSMGFVGLIILFFTYERAPFLSSRFWYLFWAIGLLVWLGFLLYRLLVKVPEQIKAREENKNFKKYLPH